MTSLMFFLSPYLLLCLLGASGARPIAEPISACDPHGEYSNAFSCYTPIDFETGDICSNQPTLSQKDLQRILEGFLNMCNPHVHELSSSHSHTTRMRVLDVEVPLPTTYLMSKAKSEVSEDFTVSKDTSYEPVPNPMASSSSTTVSSAHQDDLDEQYLLCLQQSRRTLGFPAKTDYWDQDRSMNTIFGIVVIFLVIILLAETVDALFKLLTLRRQRRRARQQDEGNRWLIKKESGCLKL